MGTNRYTNLTPSKFNPLSLQETMMVPLAKQAKHDATLAATAEAGMIDVNRLQTDDELIRGSVQDYRSKLTGVEDALMKRGINTNITKQMIDLKRQKDYNMSQDGEWGQAENAYKAYNANAAAIEKQKNLSQSQKTAGLQWAMSQYDISGGVKEGGKYQDYRGADYVNIQEKANKLAQTMSPQEISNITGWQQTSDGMRWTNGTITTEKLPENVIADAVASSLMNDDSVVNYLQDATKIGIMRNAKEHLGTAALNAGRLYQVNNYAAKQDMKFTPEWVFNIGQGVNSDGLNYNIIGSPITTNKGLTQGLDILNKMMDGDRKVTLHAASRPSYRDEYGVVNETYAEDLQAYNESIDREGNPYTIADVTDSKTLQYFNTVAEGLKENGVIQNTDLSDQETISKVRDYARKYKNYRYNVNVIQDATGGIGKYSSGQVSKDRLAILAQVKADRYNQLYMNPEDGKVYDWKQMQDIFGMEDIETVQGYVDVDNNLQNIVGNDVKNAQYATHASEFVSPHVIAIKNKDGKVLPNFYMTRNDGQTNTDRYKIDIELNNIYSAVKSTPKITKNINIGGENLKIYYVPGNEMDAEGGRQSIEGFYIVTYPDGRIKNMTKSDIQEALYESRGIKY